MLKEMNVTRNKDATNFKIIYTPSTFPWRIPKEYALLTSRGHFVFGFRIARGETQAAKNPDMIIVLTMTM